MMQNNDYLDHLNTVQREAVVNYKGPCLIIAGPGSGKTRVLTYRIAYLIQQGVDPFNILALTFTNKASKEMRTRIEDVVGTEARNLYMGTFHSVFARILRYEASKLGYPSNFTIYDMDDAKNMVKSIVKEQNLDEKTYKANQVLYRISAAKNSLITPAQYLEDVERMEEDRASNKPHIAKLYQLYCTRMFRAGAMDFDDLLVKTYELLNNHPEVLYKYQHFFQYIMIDEFQDTNTAQYAIVKMLAAYHHNISVVGDDAQSIYAFRGATIQNILNFSQDFPELNVFKLEQNYRSTQKIVKAANTLIKANQGQIAKDLFTENEEGGAIIVARTATDKEEGKFVADKIAETKQRNQLRNNDFAILYRTNAQSRTFEEALRRLNIPYVIYGGLSFYMRKEVKDLLAYLKVTINPKDEESLKRIINYPARSIGKTTMEKCMVWANEHNRSLWEVLDNISAFPLAARARNSILSFVTMIKSFRSVLAHQNAYDLAVHIAKSTGIHKELYNDKSVEGLSRYENIQELLNSIKEFVEDDTVEENPEGDIAPMSLDKSLGGYLQNVTLLTSADQEKENADAVKLMTIHAAKGLEFPVVFIGGMEENLFPSQMSVYAREDLEEERRLFYVAVTRAENELYLTFTNTRFRFGKLTACQPSRFIAEIPQDDVTFKGVQIPSSFEVERTRRKSFGNALDSGLRRGAVGGVRRNLKQVRAAKAAITDFEPSDLSKLTNNSTVQHERFGTGQVVEISGEATGKTAIINFQGIGEKKLMLKFAKLKIVE